MNPLPLGFTGTERPAPREDRLILCHLIHSPGDGQSYTLFALRKSELRDTSMIAYGDKLFSRGTAYRHKPEGVEFFFIEDVPVVLLEAARMATLEKFFTPAPQPKERKKRKPMEGAALQAARARCAAMRARKLEKQATPRKKA